MGSSPALDQNFFVQIFFGFVRLYSQIFLMSPEGPPFIFFLFCSMDVQKLPNDPLLHFSALCDLPETKKFEKKFKKIEFLYFFLTRVL